MTDDRHRPHRRRRIGQPHGRRPAQAISRRSAARRCSRMRSTHWRHIRAIDAVRVVIGAGQEELAERRARRAATSATLIIGGAERADSVRAGLAAIGDGIVLVHDAARPFCPPDVIDRLLDALESHDGAVPGAAGRRHAGQGRRHARRDGRPHATCSASRPRRRSTSRTCVYAYDEAEAPRPDRRIDRDGRGRPEGRDGRRRPHARQADHARRLRPRRGRARRAARQPHRHGLRRPRLRRRRAR